MVLVLANLVLAKNLGKILKDAVHHTNSEGRVSMHAKTLNYEQIYHVHSS